MMNEHRGTAWIAPRLVLLLFIYLSLCGCATLPPVMNYASMALSGITYVATGKGPSDHALSFATHKDCSLLRALISKPVCVEASPDTNKPVWVQLFKKRKDEFSYDVPEPPRLFVLPDTEVVQLNNAPAAPN